MTDEEIIKVIDAHRNGKAIEFRPITKDAGMGLVDWIYLSGDPSWNFYNYEYRVSDTPTYRPYTRKELVNASIEHGVFIESKMPNGYVAGYTGRIKILTADTVTTTFGVKRYDELLRDCVWANDGSPCGIYVNDKNLWT